MQQLLYACFLLFHLVPFLLTGYKPSFLNVTIVLLIALSFHIGMGIGAVRRQTFIRGTSWKYVVPAFATPVFFVLYLATRYETVLDVIRSLAEGRIQELMFSAAVERYTNGGDESALIQISTAVFFSFAILVGVELGMKVRRARVVALAVMTAVAMFIQGSDLSRASIILAILLAFCFFAFNRRDEYYQKGGAWAVKTLSIAVGAIAIVYTFGQYGRVYREANAWGIVGERAANLFLGGHYAFLAWLDMPKFGGHEFGSGMFAFVNKLMGSRFAQGNFEQIELPMGLTNIFLWYRGAMEDFSYLFVIFPMLCGYSVNSLGSHRPSRVEVLLSMFGLQLILYPFYSPLYFTVFAIPFIGAVMVLPRQDAQAVPVPAYG
jgi:hypothetical protein